MDLPLQLSLAFVGFHFAVLTNITYTQCCCQRKQFGKAKLCCIHTKVGGGVGKCGLAFELMKLEYIQNEN